MDKIIRLIRVGVLLLLLSACAVLDKPLEQQQDICFKIGQEWLYDHREVDKESRVVIVDVMMNRNKQRVYIVRVTGVEINHPNFKNYFPDGIPYFVISERGLVASLKSIVGEATWNPHYDRHYQNWRRQLQGSDYFGFTIKNKINTLEEVLNVKLGA